MLATAPARGNVMNTSKPLVFSIERIMARTLEPSPARPPLPAGSVPKGDPKHPLHLNSSIPCMIPFSLWRVPHEPEGGDDGLGAPEGESRGSGALAPSTRGARVQLQRPAQLLPAPRGPGPRRAAAAAASYRAAVVKSSLLLHAMGALCYLNRGDGPNGPAAGVNIHPVASYFPSSLAPARQNDGRKE